VTVFFQSSENKSTPSKKRKIKKRIRKNLNLRKTVQRREGMQRNLNSLKVDHKNE
jgi:hypothetical protein